MATIKSFAGLIFLRLVAYLLVAEVEGKGILSSGVVRRVKLNGHSVRTTVHVRAEPPNHGFLWGNLWPWGGGGQQQPSGVDLTVTPLDCSVKRFENVLFLGTTVGTSKNVVTPEVCVGICWQFKKQDNGHCQSVNYHPATETCDLMDKAISQNSEGQRQRGAIYMVPINCEGIPPGAPSAPPPSAPSAPAPPLIAPVSSEQRCGFTYVTPSIDLNKERNVKTRIVGGTPAEQHSFPWLVSIQKEGTKHFCGGAIIRVSKREESDIVLTASHCFEEKWPNLHATVGINFLEECSHGCKNHLKVAKYQKHPQYDHVKTINDIALVKLIRPVPFGDTIQPICLPPLHEQPKVGDPAIVAGWGAVHESLQQASDRLMQVFVPVMPDYDCQQYYPKEVIPEYHYCAGHVKGSRDSCQGDSGGPLMFNTPQGWMVRGLVSFGEGCARAGKPGVYTRVSDYRDWVEETARKLTSVPLE